MMVVDCWTLWVSLVLGATAVFILWWRRCVGVFAHRRVPYVTPLPVVGNMLDVVFCRKSMPDILNELYQKLDPHPYAGLFSFTIPVLLIRDPELIRSITVKDFDHFTDHMNFINAEKSNPLSQKMLVALKGKEWHDMRTTLSPAFTTMKIKNMFMLIADIGQQVVAYLEKRTGDFDVSTGNENLLVLEMKDFFTRITNDVIATTAFGIKVDSLSEPDNLFYRMGRDLTAVRVIVGIGYTLFPKLMQLLGIPFMDRTATEFFKSTVIETIETREKQGIVRPDVIHLLMQARRAELRSEEAGKDGSTEGKGKRLTNDDIAAQAILFFFGGFDTVSTLMTFCSYLLATHEDVQRRLQQEVDDVMKKNRGQPDYEQVMACQYLDMVISETLRMYTPGVALDRVCVRPYQLPDTETCRGVKVRPGEIVGIPVYCIHHDARYHPDPETFDPERFSPDNKHRIKPFTFLPFGSGPRVCIAQRFALMETKVVLLYLVSRFSFHVVAKTPVPLQIQPNNLTLSIKGGAWVGVRRRP
ncbi:cytochrome P450 9e2-like isoform X1 [Schistocerca serialis cubense]|uniref:cytochrome P450 9e2-like isoform X1 n=2 Tax=Schistocerca serialis cubense TaxID=2023355 RepID=UPI00214F1D16|nr:cytochrome P450 9e2-like isoform X1 [Schistocerca serialis cubense]